MGTLWQRSLSVFKAETKHWQKYVIAFVGSFFILSFIIYLTPSISLIQTLFFSLIYAPVITFIFFILETFQKIRIK